MQRLLFIFILCLSCSNLFAQACDSCTFVRGDANCDSSVNLTDVINIANGVAANQDAADSNDDGRWDISDAAYLANYLFQGGPAPPCPYPTAGKDCTPDNLETCCSPPTWALALAVGGAGITYNENDATQKWDSTLESEAVGAFGVSCFRSECRNFNICSHASPSSTTYTEIKFPIQTDQKFAKKRLQNGIQSVGIDFNVTINFQPINICPWGYNCYGKNKMYVDALTMSVEVMVGPATSPAPTQSILLTRTDLWTYVYERTGGHILCHLSSADNATPTLTWSENLDDELIGMLPNDCDEWKVFNVQVDELTITWTRAVDAVFYPDIAYQEKIITKVTPAIVYGWCTCP